MAIPDEAIAKFLALRPLRFDELERFELTFPLPSTDDRPVSVLKIVLRQSPHVASPKCVITSTGVAQLHLEADSYAQFTQLEVRSIDERQWEHLHYHVHNEEGGNLSFYCDSFSAVVVNGSVGEDAEGR